MYYGIVIISVLMFGIQIFFDDRYQRENGTNACSVMTFSFISALCGIICLAVINGFDFSVTPFTLVWAFIAASVLILYSVCTLKALERVNLSVYSLFSMLGGMMLPFVLGILIYNEDVTCAKIVCVVLIIVSLTLTVDKKTCKGGAIYYVGVFLLNGLFGTLSKAYEQSSLPKVSAAGYSLWIAIMSASIAAAALIAMHKNVRMPSMKALLYSAASGTLNRIANLLLLIALAVLPASVQYPFVTGGVIIVSTVIAAMTKQRPTKKEILAVCLAFSGILALVLIPI